MGDAFAKREAVERPHGGQFASLGGCPSALASQARGERLSWRRVVTPGIRVSLGKLGKVAAVGGYRQWCETPFDTKLEQELVNRLGKGRVGHDGQEGSREALVRSRS